MTQAEPTAAEMKSPLDAAQKIVAELQGMTSENQLLALQFATQTLRLALPTTHPAAAAVAAPAPAHLHVPHAHPGAGVPGQPTDIKSFTAAKAPQSDQQFTAVVAYFYQFEAKPSERKEAIDAETMKEAARLAGRPQVERWAMTLTNAKNAGYLNPAGDGKYTLSSVGENLVAITLPGKVWGGASNGGGSGAGKKAGKKKATIKKVPKKNG
jgi:hypothetical protein